MKKIKLKFQTLTENLMHKGLYAACNTNDRSDYRIVSK